MPCFDKKLEASRVELTWDGNNPETDLVLSSAEVLNIWEKSLKDQLNERINGNEPTVMFNSILNLDRCYPIRTLPGGFSGGFAEQVLKLVLSHFGGTSEGNEIKFQTLRNKDISEAKVTLASGRTLSFVKAYGFRNIQNIIAKIKQKRCSYDYVEIMACPNGCINGGGQVKLENPSDINDVMKSFSSVIGNYSLLRDDFCSVYPKSEVFETSYNAIEKTVSAISTQW